MLDTTLTLLASGGLALGATAAQLRGPTYWNWEGHGGDLRQRLICLPRRAPPAIRRTAGVALLAALLTGGALTAYAAEPSAPTPLAPTALLTPQAPAGNRIRLAAAAPPAPAAARAPATSLPDTLPAQVRGVVGSGSQLALQLKPVGDAPPRTLNIGDSFEDGWVLTGLDASTATMTKAGVSRTVGLNPSGALASAAPVGGASVTVNPAAKLLADAQADMATAQAELAAAQAAQSAATPETANAARLALINAQNRVLGAQNNAVRAQQGLPPLAARPPMQPAPVLGLADAQAAVDRANAALDTARQSGAPVVTLQNLTVAANTAKISLDNAQRAAAQNAAGPAQGSGQ